MRSPVRGCNFLPGSMLPATSALVFSLLTSTAAAAPPASSYFGVTPCRVLDTRLAPGPLGGPSIGPGQMRLFTVAGDCNIPPTATSVTASIAVVSPAGSGFLRVFPGDVAEPPTNTISFSTGQTRAGNGMFLLATDGSGTLAFRNLSTGAVDVVFDVTGYFDTVCAPVTVTPPSLPDLSDGVPYNAVLSASGGSGPYSFAVTSGALPGGIALSPAGVVSGTATAAGSFSFTATATDSNNCTGFQAYNLFVACPVITVSPATLPPGAFGVPYGPVTFTQTGAVGGVTWSFTGTLPTGVTLSAAGVLSGTPTESGSFPITVKATDAGGCSGSVNVVLSTCPTIAVTNPVTATGTAGTPFSQTFTQSGGALPVSFSLASGTLPAGVSLAANGTLSGTPTQTGSFSITVRATDANGCTGTGATYTLVVGCGTVTVSNPAVSTGTAGVAFSQTFTQSGGHGTVTFSLASGSFPAGLTLAPNGTLSGTPTQTGTFPITVNVVDANGCVGAGTAYTLTIVCQALTITPTSLPPGGQGAAYGPVSFSSANAIGAVTWTLLGGTLPAGITLSTSGVLSGTPAATGTFPITVKATDSNGCTGTQPLSLVINCQPIAVTNPATSTGTVNTPFSQTFTQAGAAGAATFSTASALPAGLTLSAGGVLSGTPTQSGTFPIVVKVTDGNGCTGTGGTYTLVVSCQSFTLDQTSLPQGTTGVAYPAVTFTQTGGIGAVTFTETGALPTGLTLSAAGVLSGTPTQFGSFPVTVTATDSNGCTASRDYLLVVACPGTPIALSPAALPSVETGSAFPTTTFTASGGTGPYTFAKAGALPTGMTFAVDTLSGTPTETGIFPITVSATDANGCAGSQDYVVTVTCLGVTITVAPATLSSGTVGTPYSGVTFTASGGTGPYTLLQTGALPAGLTFSGAVLSGTPTQSGSFPIAVSATDANGCVGTTSYTLVIACQLITVTNPGTASGTAGTPFSQTFTQSGAIGGATFNLASGTLPTGLTLGTDGLLSGTPTQTGSFPITVKVTDGNGCTGTSATYTLVIACQTITVTNPGTGAGIFNTAFTQTFTQTGASGVATFSIASGTLPTGLSLTVGGLLSGTPTQTGTFPITVKVTDQNGCTGTGATYTISIAPNLANDSYTAVGNTQLYVSGVAGAPSTPAVAVASVTSNDQSDAVIATALLAAPVHGTVSLDAAGRFLYTPNVGNTAADSFTYTGTSNGVSATATVSIGFSGLVWYVNGAAGVNGDGRSNSPFNTLASASTAHGTTGETIFVESAGTPTSTPGAITLKANATLWGQGTALPSIGGVTIQNTGATAKPSLTSTVTIGGNAVTISALDLATSTAAGLTNTGLTTGTTVQNNVTVTTTTGTAVSLTNAGGTFTFQAISANGGSRGIFLTGTTGSFTVTGAGGACTPADPTCTGGTLQNMVGPDDSSATPTGTAIVLNNAQSVSLSRVRIRGNSNYGVRGTSVSGFTLDSGLVDGVNGTNDAAPFNEGSAYFTNLTGSAAVSNTNISGGFADNFRVVNALGSLDRITFSGVTVGANSAANGNDGISLEAQGPAVLNATVQNSTFTAARGDLFQLNNIGTATCDLVFTGNALSNNHPAIATGGGGVTIGGGDGGGSVTFNVSSNTFRGAVGHAVLIAKSTGAGSYTGTFAGNTIGVAGVPDSGSFSGDGLKLQNAGQGTVSAAITNNQIFQYNNFGIDLLTGGSATPQSGQFTATITGNTIGSPGGQGFPAGSGLMLNAGTVVGDTYQVCLTLGGAGPLTNGLAGSALGAGTDFRLRQRQSTQVKLIGYGGAATDDAAVVSFVQSNNSGNGAPSGAASHTTGFLGGVSCP